jgi:DNA-directed RNA polymerase III subunit RPC11
MWFCPLDGTLLQIQTPSINSTSSTSRNSVFSCSTCPYSCDIKNNFIKTSHPKRKAVDDILGGAAAWENVDKTAAVCPACSYHKAYFMQMQIRSADEPMSVFYKCVQCSHQWNDK